MRGAGTVALYALRESTRRRVFVVVLVLTVSFLVLYAVGTEAAFDVAAETPDGFELDDQVITGSTLLGLAMFTTLFPLGAFAVFPHPGTCRRRLAGLACSRSWCGRGTLALLLGRFLAAAGSVRPTWRPCTAVRRDLALAGIGCPTTLHPRPGAWSPLWWDRRAAPAVSVFLYRQRHGIAVFMPSGPPRAGLLGRSGMP